MNPQIKKLVAHLGDGTIQELLIINLFRVKRSSKDWSHDDDEAIHVTALLNLPVPTPAPRPCAESFFRPEDYYRGGK